MHCMPCLFSKKMDLEAKKHPPVSPTPLPSLLLPRIQESREIQELKTQLESKNQLILDLSMRLDSTTALAVAD